LNPTPVSKAFPDRLHLRDHAIPARRNSMDICREEDLDAIALFALAHHGDTL
jgi:hypothetical protein